MTRISLRMISCSCDFLRLSYCCRPLEEEALPEEALEEEAEPALLPDARPEERGAAEEVRFPEERAPAVLLPAPFPAPDERRGAPCGLLVCVLLPALVFFTAM